MFGLSNGGTPVKAEGLLAVSEGTALHGTYHSYAGLRTAGWLTLVGSLGVGTTMAFLSLHRCGIDEPDCQSLNMPLFISGIALAGVGALAGVFMAGKKDEAVVSYETGAAEARLRGGSRFVLRREQTTF